MSSRPAARYRNWPLLIFVLNLILGLVFCFILSPRLIGSGITLLDPDGYGVTGRMLYETGRFDSLTKAPLYPAFVALVSFLTGGYHIWAVQASQCLLASFTCTLLYAVFRRTLGEELARRAGLVCALYPMLIWYTPRLWTETFLTFVLAGHTLTMVDLLQRPMDRRALLCGVTAGTLALTKGIALIFAWLIPPVLLLRFQSKAWRWILLFFLAATALIVPWTWRNWRLTGALLPIHANSGFDFYLGNGFTRHWPQAPLSYAELKAHTVQDMQTLYTGLPQGLPEDPISVDRFLLRAALNEMRINPSLIPQKLAVQSLTFWYLAADARKSILTGVLQLPVMLLALLGTLRALRRRSWASTLLIPVIGIAGVSVVVFAFARLSATIMPYLIGLASYGLWPDRGQSQRLEALS